MPVLGNAHPDLSEGTFNRNSAQEFSEKQLRLVSSLERQCKKAGIEFQKLTELPDGIYLVSQKSRKVVVSHDGSLAHGIHNSEINYRDLRAAEARQFLTQINQVAPGVKKLAQQVKEELLKRGVDKNQIIIEFTRLGKIDSCLISLSTKPHIVVQSGFYGGLSLNFANSIKRDPQEIREGQLVSTDAAAQSLIKGRYVPLRRRSRLHIKKVYYLLFCLAESTLREIFRIADYHIIKL